MRPKKPRDLVTVEDYAEHRGVSIDTVYRYIRQDKITAHKKDGVLTIDQVKADLELDNPKTPHCLQVTFARCKKWVQKRLYSIILTLLLLAVALPAPGFIAEYQRRGAEAKALEAENEVLQETVETLLKVSDKYVDLIDISKALGRDGEEALGELQKENPNVSLPELTVLTLMDKSSDFAAWINAQIEIDREKLEGYVQTAERTPNSWPVKGEITSEYGNRHARKGTALSRAIGKIGWKWHTGIDIAAPIGTQVSATAAGEAISAGWKEGYGNLVIVGHGTYQTYYGHLSRITVKEGDRLSRGDRVGEVGSTGTSTGPHLHYEVRINGTPVNPRRYLP